MRKLLGIFLLIAALAAPGLAAADVGTGGGNITLLGHIDFVGRYSAEDNNEGWNGYETYNLEFAVLGMAGQLGDNVSWVITEAFAFTPPGSLNSWASGMAVDSTGMPMNDDVGAELLDAYINLHMGEGAMLTAGRFIPPTSMTWNPHLLKAMYTINYPLLNLSGLQGGGMMQIPLPMYQTGVMLTLKGGGATLQVANVNGSDIVGGVGVPGGLMPLGVSNVVDIDKTKGTSAKLSLDSEGLHFAGWYYGEEADVKLFTPPAIVPTIDGDASIEQWGVELAYNSDSIIFQSQYLDTTLNFQDQRSTILYQSGWYVLGGVNVGPAQIVARYDYFDYDNKKIILSDSMDQEAATTLGMNYIVNENAIVGVNYTWRDIENWDANTNELAVIVEMNLF